MDRKTQERIKALMREKFAVVPYDENWPARYAEEELRLKRLLPRHLVQRITHIGSTAVPGLSGKSIIDVQVEVTDLEVVREEYAPQLEAEGYEYIWRPSIGESAPFYAWFIRRGSDGQRTHHVHVVQPDKASADRIIFRNYLRRHPEEAKAYEALKLELLRRYPKNRAAYTQNKGEFVADVLVKARREKPQK